MPHIQLRRGSALPPGEMHLVGEPLWDDTNSRFGVFNNRSGQAMEWYPVIIGDKMLMNVAQTLGGKVTGGAENNVYIDWATQDAITIRNRNTGQVYATFAAAGATFNAAAVGTPYIGLTNLIQNGSMALKRGFNEPSEVIDTSVANYKARLLAPNWMLWKTAGSGGRLVGIVDAGALFPGGANYARVNVLGAPNSSGLRVFGHGYEMYQGQMTFSCYIQGPVGMSTYHRAISENGSLLFSKTVVGTGSTQRITTTFTPPADGSRWAGFDVLYNPNFGDATSQNWYAGGAQLQYGASASQFELRPEALERALCESIYQEGRVEVKDKTDVLTVPLNNYRYGVDIYAYDYLTSLPVTISDAGARGFNVQVPAAAARTPIRYSAAMMPTTPETA